MQWDFENIVMITMKVLQINQISVLYYPGGVEMPSNK